MLKKTLLALVAPIALLAACSDDPAVSPETMPPRAWSGEPVDVFERTKVMNPDEEPTVLLIEVFEVGTGQEAKKLDTVSMHYTGWVRGRNVHFDSSYDRGEPLSFPLGVGRVIPGWDLGIKGMRVGTRARLRIPAAMAYGSTGTSDGSIPPDSNLVFDVELVELR